MVKRKSTTRALKLAFTALLAVSIEQEAALRTHCLGCTCRAVHAREGIKQHIAGRGLALLANV